ncbi:hypothetical protein HY745_01490 [Candidatus Desantisbacteria bacterium]|nr:hypothetical protein [Candidatus Desantisbacteria bacterium]
MGILTAQSYFDTNDSTEIEIRQRAQSIYNRVNWQSMLESSSQQFYLGWKPEKDENPAHPFEISGKEGYYSGTMDRSYTLDYYTDEASIVSLLAIGSETFKVPAGVFCAWKRKKDSDGLIRTYPGALFTYQFLHAFIDTNNLNLPSCPDEEVINWYENTRKAINENLNYIENNSNKFVTYGPDAWGLSAAEGPFDKYYAYGAPTIAWENTVPEDGTITYYSMVSSISFGKDFYPRVSSVLRKSWENWHWHSRFGLPDAFNDEINQAYLIENKKGISTKIFKENGKWIQRALFAIDQGPMLMHLENSRTGLIWNLMAKNPNIQRALERIKTENLDPFLKAPDKIFLESENGISNGQIMSRSNASEQKTVLLKIYESCNVSFKLDVPARYSFDIKYSNDNYGPLETVKILVDGNELGQFIAQDTGDSGYGWNIFESASSIITVDFTASNHNITLIPYDGDGYGVEIDNIILNRVD